MPRVTPRPRRAAAAASVVLALGLAGCNAGGAVSVDTDPDKPFVLEGISNLTEVAQLTGPDAMNDTAAVSVAGTDLGSMTNVGDKTFFFFGDTFGERDPESIGGQAVKDNVQKRFQRIDELLKLLTLFDGLSQRFFESHKSLREAVEMLASGEG